MDKEYLAEQYRLTVLDFKLAQSTDQEWNARKQLAKLENLILITYGDAFRQEVRENYLPLIEK